MITDNEIIKALELLEFCKSIARRGEDVLLNPDTIFSIDKIIKSKDKQLETVKLMHINDVKQKDAEIERLQKAIKVQDIMIEQQDYNIKKAKSEARKEVTERLKKKAEIVSGGDYGFTYEIGEDEIDNLLAEMEERE